MFITILILPMLLMCSRTRMLSVCFGWKLIASLVIKHQSNNIPQLIQLNFPVRWEESVNCTKNSVFSLLYTHSIIDHRYTLCSPRKSLSGRETTTCSSHRDLYNDAIYRPWCICFALISCVSFWRGFQGHQPKNPV